MMTTLNEVLAANRLLVSLGAEDQMQNIAAKSIERSLELQSRIDRALQYASESPSNSSHARNMARILDGSITIDDEIAEAEEEAERRQLHPPRPKPAPRTRGKGKKAKVVTGLSGRSTAERARIREWINEQDFDVAPFGRIPEKYIELYDLAQEELRRQRQLEYRAQKEQQEQEAGE